MSNRLIGLLIIFAFILAGTRFYYFGLEEQNKIKNNEKITKNKNLEQKLKEEKKATLIKIKKKNLKKENIKNKSVFDLTKEEQENLEKIKKLKLKKKISNILDNKDFRKINISEIIGEKNKILISLEKNKELKPSFDNYIFDKKTLDYNKLELNIKILYSKKLANNKIIFVTEKGSFIYYNNKIEYFSMFYDFIIQDGNYIGLIQNNDKYRKNNLNLKNKSGNLIILKNPKTRKTKLLISTDFEIKKILLENNQVIIVDENNEKFLLNY